MIRHITGSDNLTTAEAIRCKGSEYHNGSRTLEGEPVALFMDCHFKLNRGNRILPSECRVSSKSKILVVFTVIYPFISPISLVGPC